MKNSIKNNCKICDEKVDTQQIYNYIDCNKEPNKGSTCSVKMIKNDECIFCNEKIKNIENKYHVNCMFKLFKNIEKCPICNNILVLDTCRKNKIKYNNYTYDNDNDDLLDYNKLYFEEPPKKSWYSFFCCNC